MRAVRRSVLGPLVLVLALVGCGGPGEPTAPAGVSSAAPRSAPAPSGAGCAGAGDLPALADKGFVDALGALPVTTTFAAYAQLDPARTKKLNALNGVTAFVPVDAAWTTLDPTTAQRLAEPATQVAAVEFAIVSGRYLPEDIASGKTASLPTFRAPGSVLSVAQSGGQPVVNGTAQVVCSSIEFDGGLIYLTDTVLLPSS